MKTEVPIIPHHLLPVYRSILSNIIHIRNVLFDHLGDITKCNGLSFEQFTVLRILKDQKNNPVNMCTIQQRMATRTSNTTRLIDKLLLKGLVSRQICLGNRRKIEISITERGLLLISTIEPLIADYELKLTGCLAAAELENLNFLLEKYRINLA